MPSKQPQAKLCLKLYSNRLLINFFDLKSESSLRNQFQELKKDCKAQNRSILIKNNGQFESKIVENNRRQRFDSGGLIALA